MVKFQKCLKMGNSIKRSFPGATASQLKYYLGPTLTEERPDEVIVCGGTNNLTKKNQTEIEIVHEILEVVFHCQESGVNQVFVSGLPCRPSHQKEINEINKLLEINATSYNYEFIPTENIEKRHLYKDNVHLNYDGINLLADSFLNALKQKSILMNYFF